MKNSDGVSPTVVITSTKSSPTESTPIPITITFSEIVTGFVLSDITVGNGTAGNFAGSNAVYTADITPTVGGLVTVDINAGVCVDRANNPNIVATQFSITSYAIKINDSFTGTNGTNLTAHSISPTNIPVASWANIFSTSGRIMTIQSNRASVSTFNEGFYALEAGSADVILSVVLRLPSITSISGVYLRLDALTDASITERNCWFVAFGNGKIELYERNSSPSGILRATANMTTNASQDYAIKVVCVGSTITVTVDGSNKISYSGITTHLTSTKFGIKMLGTSTTTAIADDFKIYSS